MKAGTIWVVALGVGLGCSARANPGGPSVSDAGAPVDVVTARDAGTPTDVAPAVDAARPDVAVADVPPVVDVPGSDVVDRPLPGACVSDRDCTPVGVCDRAAGRCVECLRDADCAAGQLCRDDRSCAARVCTPGARDCLDGRTVRTCDERGSGHATSACADAPNATGACAAGACGVACAAGFGDCDASPANGCEASLRADPRHCGACGAACAVGQGCASGACAAAVTVPSMRTTRHGYGAAALPDGRVFVFGGYNGAHLTSTELYDPATNSWTTRAPMPAVRYAAAGVALPDGRVVSIGGQDELAAVSPTVIAYTPATNAWSTLASLPASRSWAAATVGRDGRVYVFNGGATTIVTNSAVYTPATNTWATIRSPAQPRVGAAAVTAPSGLIYLFGGTPAPAISTPVTAIEIYDPATDTWTASPTPLAVGRVYAGAALAGDGRVVVAGGNANTTYTNTADAFTIATNGLASLPPMSTPRANYRLLSLPDGRVLALGGRSAVSTTLATVEAYDPVTNSWR